MRYITLCILLFISTAGWANTDSKADINHVLDELHAQAAAANFDKYFAVYTSDAIFIGTDAEEVWSIHAFKAYAKPYFDQGKVGPITQEIAIFTCQKINKSLGLMSY